MQQLVFMRVKEQLYVVLPAAVTIARTNAQTLPASLLVCGFARVRAVRSRRICVLALHAHIAGGVNVQALNAAQALLLLVMSPPSLLAVYARLSSAHGITFAPPTRAAEHRRSVRESESQRTGRYSFYMGRRWQDVVTSMQHDWKHYGSLAYASVSDGCVSVRLVWYAAVASPVAGVSPVPVQMWQG